MEDETPVVAAQPSPTSDSGAIIRALELYSGIGGFRCALTAASQVSNHVQQFEVVQSWDVNTLANHVYEHNWKEKPCSRSIVKLDQTSLRKLQHPNMWTMSPPCQPYTRQGKQGDIEDPRAASFLHLVSLLTTLSQSPGELPHYIAVENVRNFERSESRERLIQTLHEAGFVCREFMASPVHIGVPNQRTRYFLLAKLVHVVGSFAPLPHDLVPVCIWQSPALGPLHADAGSAVARGSQDPNDTPSIVSDATQALASVDGCPCERRVAAFLDTSADAVASYTMPDDVSAHSEVVDEALPEHTSCRCFTKSYGRFVKGTGSLLRQETGALRYFLPSEVARLHCFPPAFTFPSDVTTTQRYRLLGNSLNVRLVARLLLHVWDTATNDGVEEG